MQLELIFTNEPRFLPGIRAFTHETLKQWPLDAAVAEKLGECVVAAARMRSSTPIRAGEEGSIELTVREDARQARIPRSATTACRKTSPRWNNDCTTPPFPPPTKSPSTGRAPKSSTSCTGSATAARARRSNSSSGCTTNTSPIKPHAAALAPFNEEAPLAPPQEYTIRRMQPDEAMQVSQLMYRAYGNSYLNEDVYYPDRVAALNASNTIISFVAVGADGRLAGHYALERDEPGPVVEGGQAVVDPAHRGRGLLDRMKDAALAEARRLQLVGVFADAVTVHTRTQQSDIKHGAHLTCVDLAIAPRTMSSATSRPTCRNA